MGDVFLTHFSILLNNGGYLLLNYGQKLLLNEQTEHDEMQPHTIRFSSTSRFKNKKDQKNFANNNLNDD